MTTILQTIQNNWDKANGNGDILYRDDTLTEKDVPYGDITFHLIHNECRDAHDQTLKKAAPVKEVNPEVARTEDGWFKIEGRRVSCMRYQSALVPVEPLDELTEPFLEALCRFALEHPSLTLMYNGLGAGKTVLAQFCLVSFSRYDALVGFNDQSEPLCRARGFEIARRLEPCYALSFKFTGEASKAAVLLFRLAKYMEERNFNFFLFDETAFFIPRENVEIPTGFDNHRFGGLEMLGCFVMKSVQALHSADPEKMLRGIREISLKPERQSGLEAFLSKLGD